MRRTCLPLLLAVALTPLGGCTDPATPQTAPEAAPTETAAPPIAVLRLGQQAAIDLWGNGQASVTVTAADLSPPAAGRENLVVTVDIRLLKAGKPVTAGPENFIFRDTAQATHPAQVSAQVAAPQLTSTAFTTAGQASHGRVYFDVPTGTANGGHVQLVTGKLVHAMWQIGKQRPTG
ncbi:hypothetical protein AB0K20_32435 [Micromonospora matsumotoense]|uniref:DUF1942 domain-containing protein n=1 Tax=Micromonospora matsumotoense TaxID=121616 RepID=UPI00342434B2